jgi:hypothetical protein
MKIMLSKKNRILEHYFHTKGSEMFFTFQFPFAYKHCREQEFISPWARRTAAILSRSRHARLNVAFSVIPAQAGIQSFVFN